MATAVALDRPIIGVTSYLSGSLRVAQQSFVAPSPASSCLSALRAAGADSVMLPAQGDVDAVLDTIDGVLFSGGGDVDPKYYGAKRHQKTYGVSELRDWWELTLAKRALERDMPVMGICRGLQVLTVALGGKLYQDLPSHTQVKRDDHWGSEHIAMLTQNSPFRDWGIPETLTVNSFHHQAVKTVPEGCVVAALALDTTIEAIVSTRHFCAFGTQWHPEMMHWQDKPSATFFEVLVAHAELYREQLAETPAVIEV